MNSYEIEREKTLVGQHSHFMSTTICLLVSSPPVLSYALLPLNRQRLFQPAKRLSIQQLCSADLAVQPSSFLRSKEAMMCFFS